ncbi:MAG TPA: class I SAM-dependent methyltransferase [Candidatus Baltobacteraceae bacterium]|jgi:ubiquinone/menaquinone biosynthesis C-methylase UbiE|nr:class I SAM-dependent methyltransferase [Candidatus Baltobacteraceae bacterium]
MSELVLDAATITAMSYNELIGLVRETNRPPGGIHSIADAARLTFLRTGSRVLEVGTATGYTAIELASLSGCQVTSIDINAESLAEARVRAASRGLADIIAFELGDATSLSYDDGKFDVVFCGNVTSLVSDRGKAFKEYARVLKTGGFLVAIPMYYVDEPSAQLVADVSAAIHVNIQPQYRPEWITFFNRKPFSLFATSDYRFDTLLEETVADFSAAILSRPHLQILDPSARTALTHQYSRFMELFRVNLSHMGFTVMVLRKEDLGGDRELFTATKI